MAFAYGFILAAKSFVIVEPNKPFMWLYSSFCPLLYLAKAVSMILDQMPPSDNAGDTLSWLRHDWFCQFWTVFIVENVSAVCADTN